VNSRPGFWPEWFSGFDSRTGHEDLGLTVKKNSALVNSRAGVFKKTLSLYHFVGSL